MTSLVATLGLTYDAEDVQSTDGIFLEIVSGLYDGIDVRGDDVTVPYADGQVSRPRRRHNRKIGLKGYVRGGDPLATTVIERQMDYSTKRRFFDTLFDPARLPATLIVLMPDGLTTATIEARPLNFIPTLIVPSEFCYMDVEMLSVDPDWTWAAS